VLIGKAGDTIRNMQKLSGARIQIVKDSDTAPDATTRTVELLGSAESIDKAEQLIRDVLAEVVVITLTSYFT
jgi:far upstream element-binding protein